MAEDETFPMLRLLLSCVLSAERHPILVDLAVAATSTIDTTSAPIKDPQSARESVNSTPKGEPSSSARGQARPLFLLAPLNEDQNAPVANKASSTAGVQPQEDSDATAANRSTSTPTPASQSLSAPKKSRRKLLEERSNRAARSIQMFFRYHVVMRNVLKRIRRAAATTVIQKMFRGHRTRVSTKSELAEWRRTWGIQYCRAPFHLLSVGAKLHAAATRIQCLFRRRLANLERQQAVRRRAVIRIQGAFNVYLWRKRAIAYSNRKATAQLHVGMAVRIQALVRGFLVRKWFTQNRAQLEEAAVERFSETARSRRLNRLSKEAQRENIRIAERQQQEAERELLAMVLKSSDPNREIVEWSTRQTYRLAHDRQLRKIADRSQSGTNTRAADGRAALKRVPAPLAPRKEAFIPSPVLLEESNTLAKVSELQSTFGAPKTLSSIQKRALAIAKARITEKYGSEIGFESDTMKYALKKPL